MVVSRCSTSEAYTPAQNAECNRNPMKPTPSGLTRTLPHVRRDGRPAGVPRWATTDPTDHRTNAPAGPWTARRAPRGAPLRCRAHTDTNALGHATHGPVAVCMACPRRFGQTTALAPRATPRLLRS